MNIEALLDEVKKFYDPNYFMLSKCDLGKDSATIDVTFPKETLTTFQTDCMNGTGFFNLLSQASILLICDDLINNQKVNYKNVLDIASKIVVIEGNTSYKHPVFRKPSLILHANIEIVKSSKRIFYEIKFDLENGSFLGVFQSLFLPDEEDIHFHKE